MRKAWKWAGITAVATMLLVGCKDGAREDVPLDKIDLELQVIRLDDALYQTEQALRKDSTLSSIGLYQQYFQPSRGFIIDWIFGGNDSLVSDSMIGQAMVDFAVDPYGTLLLDTIHTVLGGLDLKESLTPLLKRYKYYFPDKPMPEIVAYVDGYPRTAQQGIDQVYIAPLYLGIGLHYFMGTSFQYYPMDLPRYLSRRCTPEHLPSLVAHKIADVTVPEPDLRSNPVLIDYVISEGIKMILVDRLLGPAMHDTLKLFYEATQIDWANLYEGRVYKDLVADLYSSDPELQRRYVDDSPFTSQLNRASAPRLGAFIGWRIMEAYLAKHPDITLPELVQRTDYQAIFKDAGYRPPKEE